MIRKIAVSLCVMFAVFASAAMTVGQASGADMKIAKAKSGFLAIYGFPDTENVAEKPVGGGTGSSFAFSQDLKLQSIGPVSMAFGTTPALPIGQLELGLDLSANHTGKNQPLVLKAEFVEAVDTKGAVKEKETATLAPIYADTSDEAWEADICAPEAMECRIEPTATVGTGPAMRLGTVTLNGPVIGMITGTLWGRQATVAGEPLCYSLALPLATAPTLTRRIGGVDTTLTAISGTLCLREANNDVVTEASEDTEPTVEVTNE